MAFTCGSASSDRSRPGLNPLGPPARPPLLTTKSARTAELLDENRAELLSPSWKGDRYAVFEDAKTKSTPLVFRLALDNSDDTAHFFGQYSEALEHKYKTRTELFRRPNFFQFQSESGGVFLRCVATQCITVESATRETFDKINHAIGWDPAPAAVSVPASPETVTGQPAPVESMHDGAQ